MITLVRLKCLKSSPLVIYDALGLFLNWLASFMVFHWVNSNHRTFAIFEVRVRSCKGAGAKVRRCDGEVQILISLGSLKLHVTTYMYMYL